ncbi:MAG TPA: hypothetical protein DEF45_16570 [Rhodopirellula sp.]|nr:hypothetical protein [Rhodopirellula sp.]
MNRSDLLQERAGLVEPLADTPNGLTFHGIADTSRWLGGRQTPMNWQHSYKESIPDNRLGVMVI